MELTIHITLNWSAIGRFKLYFVSYTKLTSAFILPSYTKLTLSCMCQRGLCRYLILLYERQTAPFSLEVRKGVSDRQPTAVGGDTRRFWANCKLSLCNRQQHVWCFPICSVVSKPDEFVLVNIKFIHCLILDQIACLMLLGRFQTNTAALRQLNELLTS